MKMPTIVGIFIFIGRENFMLSRIEQEKRYTNSRPDLAVHPYSLFRTFPICWSNIIPDKGSIRDKKMLIHENICLSMKTYVYA